MVVMISMVQSSIVHSLSLSTKIRPDMTEILLEKGVNSKVILSSIHSMVQIKIRHITRGNFMIRTVIFMFTGGEILGVYPASKMFHIAKSVGSWC